MIVILILTFVITMYDCHVNENQNGVAALICASANGHKDVVKLLTDKGAKVDMQGKVSIELLHAWSWRHVLLYLYVCMYVSMYACMYVWM